MQVKKLLFLALTPIIVPYKAIASALKDSVDFSYDFYSDNVGVTVYSPVMGIKKALSDKWGIVAKLRLDAISAASIKNASARFNNDVITDAVTGASGRAGFDDFRVAPDISFIYEGSTFTTTLGSYVSNEIDYNAVSGYFNVDTKLNDANTVLSFGGSYSYEAWSPRIKRKMLAYDSSKGEYVEVSDKQIYTLSAGLTQLINPHAYISAMFEYTEQNGFLSNPYKYYKGINYARFDLYPNKRRSFPFSIRYVQQFGDKTSTNLFYRFYTDSWGLSSNTFDGSVYHDVLDNLTLGFKARVYGQSGVGFIKSVEDYANGNFDDNYFVSDYKYSALATFDAGISMMWRPEFFEDENVLIKLNANFYMSDDNKYIYEWYGEKSIKASYFTTALNYEF